MKAQRSIRILLVGVAVGALSVPVNANLRLLELMFRNSSANFNAWCYGYTIAWAGGELAPSPLTNEVLSSVKTAKRLDTNFFSNATELPGWVILRNRTQWPFVSAAAIDEFADILQHEAWPNPPQGTTDEQIERYRLWLRNNLGKLVKNQDDLDARMANLRGRYLQPMTVIVFPPRNTGINVAAFPCHNVIVSIGPRNGLQVLDPNDFEHRPRPATLANYKLQYQLPDGQGNLVHMSWNNVFITREYIGRVGGAPGDPPVYWEWYPDTEWFGDMADIDFDPSELWD